MSAFHFTSRAALAVTLACGLLTAIVSNPVAARPGPGGVRVDVGPLLANSGEPTAAWVAHELPGAIEAALVGSGQAGAPVSVRIDFVLLGPNSGGVGPAGSSPDQMIGEVSVGGVTRPLRATTYYYPSAVDNVMIEQSNHLRVSRLVQAFADWSARGY